MGFMGFLSTGEPPNPKLPIEDNFISGTFVALGLALSSTARAPIKQLRLLEPGAKAPTNFTRGCLGWMMLESCEECGEVL